MTIQEAITKLDNLKPNQYQYAEKLKWISDVDGRIYNEVISKRENEEEKSWSPYSEETDPSLVLLVSAPYEDIYIWYMSAMIDNINGEFTRYNNCIAQFNGLYQSFVDFWIRNHKTTGAEKFRF